MGEGLIGSGAVLSESRWPEAWRTWIWRGMLASGSLRLGRDVAEAANGPLEGA